MSGRRSASGSFLRVVGWGTRLVVKICGTVSPDQSAQRCALHGLIGIPLLAKFNSALWEPRAERKAVHPRVDVFSYHRIRQQIVDASDMRNLSARLHGVFERAAFQMFVLILHVGAG